MGSCINTSSIWAPAQGQQIAEAVASQLSQIQALPLHHPEARLSAFSDPKIACRLADMIEGYLKIPGAFDISSQLFGVESVVETDGYTFLMPKVIYCSEKKKKKKKRKKQK